MMIVRIVLPVLFARAQDWLERLLRVGQERIKSHTGSAFFVAFVLLAQQGCNTTIHEVRTFQSVDAKGQISYYRVGIDGVAQNAQTTYRSGQYDEEAVNALFGDVTDNDHAVASIMARKKADAIEKAAQQYFSYLADLGKSSDDVVRARARLAFTLQPTTMISGHDPVLGDASVRLKHVLMLNAKVSEIEKAIAQFVETNESMKTLLTAVAASKRDAYIAATATQGEFKVSIEVLKAARTRAVALSTPVAASEQQTVRDLYDELAKLRVP